ncbi:MAG: hypothetical protein CM1200mP2_08370 [Planctomycetaceae bacterium]|nr:MAG: hypothetical protein CM1200mP2_08370 [Planctomycetaceae bacterium]
MSRGEILELGLLGGLRCCLGRRRVRVVLVFGPRAPDRTSCTCRLLSRLTIPVAGQQVAEPLLLFVDWKRSVWISSNWASSRRPPQGVLRSFAGFLGSFRPWHVFFETPSICWLSVASSCASSCSGVIAASSPETGPARRHLVWRLGLFLEFGDWAFCWVTMSLRAESPRRRGFWAPWPIADASRVSRCSGARGFTGG